MITAQTTETAIQRATVDFSEPLLVTIATTCGKLGLSAATVWRLLDKRELDSVLVGRRRLVRYESVKALAARGTRQ
jgi:excisionase family DNA binding protein